MSDSLQPHGLYSPWNSPGQNTEMGSLSLLQGIFPTQGLNPGLSHCRRILYQLSHKGSPRILEWVAYPFSRGSSGPRNGTGVSCIQADALNGSYPEREEWRKLPRQSTSAEARRRWWKPRAGVQQRPPAPGHRALPGSSSHPGEPHQPSERSCTPRFHFPG